MSDKKEPSAGLEHSRDPVWPPVGVKHVQDFGILHWAVQALRDESPDLSEAIEERFRRLPAAAAASGKGSEEDRRFLDRVRGEALVLHLVAAAFDRIAAAGLGEEPGFPREPKRIDPAWIHDFILERSGLSARERLERLKNLRLKLKGETLETFARTSRRKRSELGRTETD